MIDAFEPSPPVTWYSRPSNRDSNFYRPLVNMSYILNSQAGKLWAADQLDAIARRYLPKSTRRIATTVRENLSLIDESVKAMGSMGPNMPPVSTTFQSSLAIPDQSDIAAQFITSSPGPTSTEAHNLFTGTSTNPMENQSQGKLEEHDVYGQGPHSWGEI